MTGRADEKRDQLQEPVVALLGAGSSVDAGLLTSARLTEAIYSDFASNRHQSEYAHLLAYVISKLQTRNAKLGLSPYRPIDVEELFDALRILFRRDQLLVSEFVERWDGTISDHFQKFDVRAIKAALSPLIS